MDKRAKRKRSGRGTRHAPGQLLGTTRVCLTRMRACVVLLLYINAIPAHPFRRRNAQCMEAGPSSSRWPLRRMFVSLQARTLLTRQRAFAVSRRRSSVSSMGASEQWQPPTGLPTFTCALG